MGVPRVLRAARVRPCPAAVLSPGPAGTRLPAADIGARSAATGEILYGLADRGHLFGVAYPAISRDRGRTWQVDGPCFYYAAAQGASGVSRVGVLSRRRAYMWGLFSNFIRVTRNGGRTWWETGIADGVQRVTRRGHVLIARAAKPERGVVYRSTDGGFTWRIVWDRGARRS